MNKRKRDNRMNRGAIILLCMVFMAWGTAGAAGSNSGRGPNDPVSPDRLTREDSDRGENRKSPAWGLIPREGEKKKKRLPVGLMVVGATLLVGGVMILVAALSQSSGDEGDDTNGEDPERQLEWITIPAGSFRMGDNFDEGFYYEKPVHEVFLDTYQISRYEVTFSQYDAFCDDTGRAKPSDNGWGRGSRPVINVSWTDARDFCDWLSAREGRDIRLPTEAQWEKAARGDQQVRFPWGNHDPFYNGQYFCNYAPTLSTRGVDGYENTAPAGMFPQGASLYGVEDMAGNVQEWCRDWFVRDYYSVSPEDNPEGPASPDPQYLRVIRGGSWESDADDLRCAWRGGGKTSYSYWNLGFRVVAEGD